MKTYKLQHFIYGLVVGLLIGVGSMMASYICLNKTISQWKKLQMDTSIDWLKDRRAWRDGKPFNFHYGRHWERW